MREQATEPEVRLGIMPAEGREEKAVVLERDGSTAAGADKVGQQPEDSQCPMGNGEGLAASGDASEAGGDDSVGKRDADRARNVERGGERRGVCGGRGEVEGEGE